MYSYSQHNMADARPCTVGATLATFVEMFLLGSLRNMDLLLGNFLWNVKQHGSRAKIII